MPETLVEFARVKEMMGFWEAAGVEFYYSKKSHTLMMDADGAKFTVDRVALNRFFLTYRGDIGAILMSRVEPEMANRLHAVRYAVENNLMAEDYESPKLRGLRGELKQVLDMRETKRAELDEIEKRVKHLDTEISERKAYEARP